MTSTAARVNLVKAKGCPNWTYANADAAGYYVVHYQDGMLNALLKDEKTLSLPERVGLIGDIAALTQGYMPLGEAMALVPKLAHDPDRSVVTKTLRIVGDLGDHLVPDNLKPNYRRYMSDQYKQRAQQLGWKAKPGEDDDSHLLRPEIVGVVAEQAEDPGSSKKQRS